MLFGISVIEPEFLKPEDKVGASVWAPITFNGLSSEVAFSPSSWASRLKLAKAKANNATPCLRVIFFMYSLCLYRVLRLRLNLSDIETQSQ